MSTTVLALLTAINDATMLAGALTPLVQKAVGEGRAEVTDEEVEAARAKVTSGLDALDAAIAKAREQA